MWEMKAMSSEIESIIASIPGQENPPTTLTTLKKYLQDALTQNKKLSAIPKVYQEKMIEVIEQNNLTCPIFRYWEQFEAMHAKKRQIDRV